MSSRFELLFQAHGKISNPFLLCTVLGKRTRQRMISANRDQSTAEIVECVLEELLAGVLTFQMKGETEPKSKTPPLHSYTKVESGEVLEGETR